MWCAIRRREATASMVPSNIGYSLHEAFRHFRRNWSTVLGAIVTIFLSLFVIGMFVLGSVLVGNLVGNVEDRVTIQAFLSDNADKTAVEALQKKVDGWKNVESVSYKSKEEALKQYKETMSNRNAADAVAALDGENPVPASLVIKLSDPQDVEKVANKLIKDADFAKVADNASNPSDSVQYGRETVERLFSVTYYLRIGAIVLVALLAFIAFVFINNTIRLAISARRREIAIRLRPGGHCAQRRPRRRHAQAPEQPEVPLVRPVGPRAGGHVRGAHRNRHAPRHVWLYDCHEALPQGLAKQPASSADKGGAACGSRRLSLPKGGLAWDASARTGETVAVLDGRASARHTSFSPGRCA